MQNKLPSHVEYLIIGGGIIGLSIAYHLTRLGHRDVLLLERSKLTSGTTWHAAGLVTQLRANENMAKLAQYSAELFTDLESLTGQATGFRQTGSITVAATQARMEELKRGASMGRSFGLDVEMIDAAEAKRRVPLLEVSDVLGAAWIASDGMTNPIDTAMAFAAGARQGGATILENTPVNRIVVEKSRLVGVETDEGLVRAEKAVICAGLWSRNVAADLNWTVPLHAAEHFYIVTEIIPNLSADLPTIRDMDAAVYAKPDAGKLLVGFFEQRAKPWGMNGIPRDFSFDALPDDFDHIEPYLAAAINRMPLLADVGLQLNFNGPESFTPDNRFLLGPAPEIAGLYAATGFNSCGIESSGGAGKVMAEWMSTGVPASDYWEMDVRRAMPFQRNRRYLYDRTTEAVGNLWNLHWPHKSPKTARNVRVSPLHDRLAQAGASFGEAAGWERPQWFGAPGSKPATHGTFGKDDWFHASAAEHAATRSSVALFDQTSFAHLLVQGPNALALLQKLSTNDVDVPVGRIVYTPWLNARGGMESDVTICRTADEEFLVVTAAVQRIRDLAWLKDHARESGGHVSVTDVSSGYVTLSVMGPRSRELLSRVSPADFSDAAFPFATASEIEIGYGLVLAFRMTFVGELGWELHIPTEQALGIYDAIMAAGYDLDLRLAGYVALNSLRVEAGYRDWGADVADEDTPLESGLGFTVAWDKPSDFIGRNALEVQRGKTPRRRLVQFAVPGDVPLMFGTEPVWRNGILVGYLRSAGFGHTLGCGVGMGYVNADEGVSAQWLQDGIFELEIAGTKYAAVASLRPFYDAGRTRVKGQYFELDTLIAPELRKAQ
ncbi:FAD-dependent oxidoreductase [Shinella sp. SUS2]|uniref:GcvT family protein n=1 Tax=unclassified Shinella TaxID=2643062 RepID=UPI00068255DC|nr:MULTISPECIES: FAD-dependent oxidoreductase [unclassified Shinella]KNY13257.1 FAD-dependent oxidoreductase [Shinella sp. SUS2]KOC72058.1 FAD-dependent oxidoreductase [Shinella sp. GWS1]